MSKTRYNPQERIGVNAVQSVIIKDFGWIFREIPNDDVGIDAMVEEVVEGSPTGRFLSLQIKSGPSHAEEIKTGVNKGDYSYYASKTHIDYWLNGNTPVIFIWHNEKSSEEGDIILWQVVQEDTIEELEKTFKIILINEFNIASKDSLTKIFDSKLLISIKKIELDLEQEQRNLIIKDIHLSAKNIDGIDVFYKYPIVENNEHVLGNMINYVVYEEVKEYIQSYHELNDVSNPEDLLEALKVAFIQYFNSSVLELTYDLNISSFSVLSLWIKITTVTAYNYTKFIFFNFDLNTGNRITLSQIFFEKEVKIIREEFLKEKNNQLLIYIDKLNNARDYHSAQHLESRCINDNLDENEENRFVVSKGGITFYPDYSLPTYLPPISDLKPILFPYRKLKNIINPYGVLGKYIK